MTDISSRKILGLNQQTYQRLKLALSLNLRRQLFLAVCDDRVLRDRMSAQLQAEISRSSATALANRIGDKLPELQNYPRLVRLDLDLSDPNPVAQVTRWLSRCPAPKVGKLRAPNPAFQILGIEQLTRQPAAIQRLFLAHLQEMERSLPALDSSLVLWMPQPWYRALSQCAPEFWQCRTGVFEFIGDPTPLAHPKRTIRVEPQSPRPGTLKSLVTEEQKTAVSAHAAPLSPVIPAPQPPQEPVVVNADVWTILAQDLAQLDAPSPQPPQPENPANRPVESPSLPPQPSVALHSQSAIADDLEHPLSLLAFTQVPDANPLVVPALLPDAVPASEATVALVDVPSTGGNQGWQTTTGQTAAIAQGTTLLPEESTVGGVATVAPPVVPELGLEQSQPLLLLQYIEQLHQSHASADALADAYQKLGNFYRDRIEQGDITPEHLTIAIQSYEQTLVWLRESSPLRTDILNDLGNLYWMISRFQPAPQDALNYLRQSVQVYQDALTKVNPQTQADAYPMIHNNLGAAFSDLARYENAVENLQQSIQCYHHALEHRAANHDEMRYASTQNNLGTAYWNLAQHQQPLAHLKQAIAAYSEALTYYRPEREPINYAMIQNNLGTAYWNISQYEQTEDWLRLALNAYQAALQYRTVDVNPTAFAATQNNVGTAYLHLANHAKHDLEARHEYLQKAIAAYQETLNAVQPLNGNPQTLNFDLASTQNNLGLAHYHIAIHPTFALDTNQAVMHLEKALDYHLQALQGWQQKPDYREVALGGLLQTIRTLYERSGITGQNLAFSKLPSALLAEVMTKL